MKRKQYDTYGTAGFDQGSAGSRQQYWRGGPTVDPEELFRKIFGEFSGSPFGDFHTVFDQPQEVTTERLLWLERCCLLAAELRGWGCRLGLELDMLCLPPAQRNKQ